MAAYDGKLVKPKWIKRENMREINKYYGQTLKGSLSVVDKQQVTQLSHFSFY